MMVGQALGESLDGGSSRSIMDKEANPHKNVCLLQWEQVSAPS